MRIVIPMAGLGQRFVNDGYADPKPLIRIHDVEGRRMILEHVLDMFQDPSDEFVFICNSEHLMRTTMMDRIHQVVAPFSTVVPIEQHKKGPVWTCMPALPHIDDNEPVIISYCDGTIKWDRPAFEEHVKDMNLDGCLITHTGFHPHTLNSTKMAFMRVEDGLVTEVKEKESYTDDPLTEHASSGQYYFRKGSYVKKYFQQAIDQNINYNGEHYITLVYNLLIRDGLRVGYFDTPHAAILGTPEEVKNFEAWATIVRGSQVKSEADLIKCYNYWKNYHRKDQ
jgi:bifunctional N-acetylglucosamine-1-phosphate-uridyltransferase/glucosamine-1-phosphate-acetyltransferase GlmU-like protein